MFNEHRNMMSKNPIYVTQPTLPPLSEFVKELTEIWEKKWLTNNGEYHRTFERELATFLGVPYVSLFANGTLALITALQVLRITGEVITTPYSFVATTHSLWWNNIKPVFVDIDPINCNLDPAKIEAAITPRTTAILPVHVYGNPCQIELIKGISEAYGLKLIYDAAHCFGVNLNNQSLAHFGDLSILSFHATKVFNTMEGGAIISHDRKTKERIDHLKNFGFADETTVIAPGINSKMNEMQAALGSLQLKYYNQNRNKRKVIDERYRSMLTGVQAISLLNYTDGLESNYAYFPIFINKLESQYSRDHIYQKLKEKHIYSRRYFYPLISQFPMYSGLASAGIKNLPEATKTADEVLCLPIYADLSIRDQHKVINSLLRILESGEV
jgi:dTDP-4-amino-4,6-dideoxygalactose transaminase